MRMLFAHNCVLQDLNMKNRLARIAIGLASGVSLGVIVSKSPDLSPLTTGTKSAFMIEASRFVFCSTFATSMVSRLLEKLNNAWGRVNDQYK